MKQKMKRAWLVAILSLSCASASRACSLRDDFLPPSNYELAGRADDIVLARAASAQVKDEKHGSTDITFDVLRTLKGRFAGRTFKTWGRVGPEHVFGRSHRGDFSGSRPGMGSCVADDYSIGHFYLLFLSHPRQNLIVQDAGNQARWEIGVSPLSRDREEVDAAGHPWVRAVEEYVRISRLRDHQQENAALRALAAHAARLEAGLPRDLERDIRAHFSTVSPLKSYAELKALQAGGASEMSILSAFSQGAHPEAFEEMVSALGKPDTPYELPLWYLQRVRDPRRVQVLADLFLKPPGWTDKEAPQDLESWRLRVAYAMTSAAGASDTESMLEALWASDLKLNSGQEVARWFTRYPSAQAAQILREKAGG